MGGALSPTAIAPAITLIIYMALISAVAYSLWSRLLAVNPVSRVSVFGFMNPVFGVLLSALLLGEGAGTSPVTVIVALLLVCGGHHHRQQTQKSLASYPYLAERIHIL